MNDELAALRHANELRRCLADLDVPAMRALWLHIAPHLPQPVTDGEILSTMHMARTQTRSMGLPRRAYSHAWLLERGLPSMLPDYLKRPAERLYPVTVEAVGISVNAPPHRKALAGAIQQAMSDAVLDTYADGIRDPAIVKVRMFEARARVHKQG